MLHTYVEVSLSLSTGWSHSTQNSQWERSWGGSETTAAVRITPTAWPGQRDHNHYWDNIWEMCVCMSTCMTCGVCFHCYVVCDLMMKNLWNEDGCSLIHTQGNPYIQDGTLFVAGYNIVCVDLYVANSGSLVSSFFIFYHESHRKELLQSLWQVRMATPPLWTFSWDMEETPTLPGM